MDLYEQYKNGDIEFNQIASGMNYNHTPIPPSNILSSVQQN